MLSGSPHSPQTYKVVQTNVWHSSRENAIKTSISYFNPFKNIYIVIVLEHMLVECLCFHWTFSKMTNWPNSNKLTLKKMKSALCQGRCFHLFVSCDNTNPLCGKWLKYLFETCCEGHLSTNRSTHSLLTQILTARLETQTHKPACSWRQHWPYPPLNTAFLWFTLYCRFGSRC